MCVYIYTHVVYVGIQVHNRGMFFRHAQPLFDGWNATSFIRYDTILAGVRSCTNRFWVKHPEFIKRTMLV